MHRFKKYKLDLMDKDEKILKIVHRNWFNIIRQFLIIFAILFLIMASNYYYPLVFPNLEGSEFDILSSFIASTFYLILWIYAFLIWVDYYFDIWIITNKRVINIEQKGMFVRHVSELRYNKIEDVSVEINGFLQTIINYGDVIIQTAAETHKFRFRMVTDPHEIKGLIMKMQKEHEKSRHAQLRDSLFGEDS